MSTEIYNDLQLRKSSHLDKRLSTVSSFAGLPDLTVASNFIYEGARVYVTDENADYQAQFTSASPTQLVWVKQSIEGLVTGTINILPANTVLDLSNVSPDISKCNEVVVNVVGGSSANIVGITNWPSSETKLTFYSSVGHSITYKHTDYDVAGVGDVVIEDGQDITIVGRNIGNESLTLEQNNSAAYVQFDATQFIKTSELPQNILNLAIVDNLTSNSTTSALSANQGQTLNNLINGKQNTLIQGEHITIINDTVSALPWNWIKTTVGKLGIGVTEDIYLTTTWGSTITQNYRLVKFNSARVMMLPVALNPSILSNWIELSSSASRALCNRYSIFRETPSGNLISGKFYPAISTTSSIGDSLPISFLGQAGVNKFNLNFTSIGLYKVRYKLNWTATTISDFTAKMYITDNSVTDTVPLGSVNTLVDVSSGNNMILETLMDVTTLLSNTGITVEIESTSGFSSFDYNSDITGWVEITKYN